MAVIFVTEVFEERYTSDLQRFCACISADGRIYPEIDSNQVKNLVESHDVFNIL